MSKNIYLNRRKFLKQSTAIAAAAMAGTTLDASARSIVPARGLKNGLWLPDDADNYDFLMPRICANNPDWDFGPAGDRNFLEQFGAVMRCKIKIQDNTANERPENGLPHHFNSVVDLTSLESMRKFPFLFMMGSGSFPHLSGKKLENMTAYLHEGGSMLMDECASSRRSDQFFFSSVDWMRQIFKPEDIRRIPEDHEVYKSVYDISEPNFKRWNRIGGRSQGNSRVGSGFAAHNLGCFIGERLAVFICNADIHCGWLDPHNSWGKRALNQESTQTGINVVTYFLSH